VVRPNAHGRT
jgi:hypothetical protein